MKQIPTIFLKFNGEGRREVHLLTMKDIQIKSVQVFPEIQDIGAAAAKLLPASRRNRYKATGKYSLIDGQEVIAVFLGKTKPKLLAEIESTKENVAAGRMKACFDDDGRFWATSVSYSIG